MRDDMYMYTQNRFISGNHLQNRAQYGFEMVTSAHYRQHHEMRSEMPSDVLQLFKANQIGFLRAPTKKKCRPLDPVCQLSMNLTQMFAIPNLEMIEDQKRETRAERIERIAHERASKNEKNIGEKMQQWNPFTLPQVTGDPEKTLFVSRLNYKTTEKEIKHQFQRYGLIKSVYLARDQQGNSRGYAFVEFENKDDFNHAYKNSNQRKIAGRRVIVDYERGRTLLKWRPRRFGGGLGDLRLTKEEARKYEEKQRLKREAKLERNSKSRERSREKRDRRNNEERDRRKEKKDKKEKKDRRDRRDHSN